MRSAHGRLAVIAVTMASAVLALGTRFYGLTSGSVTVTFHGTGDCELNGTGTFDLLTANAGAHSPVVTVTNGAAYTAGLAAPGAQVIVVKSNCTDPSQNGQTFGYPLFMTALIYSATGLPVPSPPVYAGSASRSPTPGDALYH
jgi:hypothetical protein